MTARYELTPLTTLTAEATMREDRFTLSPDRDSDATDLRVGARFDPFALLKGTAQIGYKQFRPRAGAVLSPYDGPTANVDIAFVARESTRLGLRVLRTIEYSYTAAEPYYVLTGVAGTVSQHVAGPVDVQAKVEANQLAYRAAARVASTGDVDQVNVFGGGIGYRIGRGSRIGMTADHQRRTSASVDRVYAGWRYELTFGVEY